MSTAEAAAGTGAGGSSRGRRRVWVALAILAIGFLLGCVGLVFAFRSTTGSLRAQASPIPAVLVRDLRPGRYDIYEQTGTRSLQRVVVQDPASGSNSGGSHVEYRYPPAVAGPTTLTPESVIIVGPDGRRVPPHRPGGPRNAVGRNERVYTEALQFDVSQRGRYRLSFTRPGRVFVAPSAGTQARRSVPGVLAMLLGGALASTGGVLALVWTISNWRRRVVVAPVGAPPGWFPDPQGGGGRRYWDGTRWTDQVAAAPSFLPRPTGPPPDGPPPGGPDERRR